MAMPTENPQFYGQWTVWDSKNWLRAKSLARQRNLSAWIPGLSTFKVTGLPATLSVRKDLESSFHHCGSPVKLVQAGLRARKSIESSFHRCVGPVKLVQECLCARKTWQKPF